MVTLREVADYVGIDVGTVSRVLNGKDREARISRKRATLIRRVAGELGYTPNTAARAISTGRFGCLALLLATDRRLSDLPGSVLDSIQAEMGDNDLHLIVAALPDQKLTSDGYVPKILRELMADGLIINYSHHIPDRMVDLIQRHGIPSVWMNSRMEADCVYYDDLAASRRATKYLGSLGHRRIAYVDCVTGAEELENAHHSTLDRCAGYTDAMRSMGLAPMVIRGSERIPSQHRAAFLKQLLGRPDRPTALVTYSDGEAIPAYVAAAEMGLRVPEQLSLVTFAGSSSGVVGKRLTTCCLPYGEMGAAAVRTMPQKLQNRSHRLPPRVLALEFDAGETCAPPGD